MANDANVYPIEGNNPTIINSDSSKANLGFCFSGGGSRALTCAWGQMLGMNTVNLMEKARYISSVSGGTWASSIYSYLPSHISDNDLLGAYYPPAALSLSDGTDRFNVNKLGQYSFGQVPAGLGIENLVTWSGLFLLLNPVSNYKWLWAFGVGKFVLEPFGLRAQGENVWSSAKFFSLSESYAATNFPQNAPALDNFFYVRAGRPFVIMNDNIMEKVDVPGQDTPNIVQLPNQATPVSTGAQGQTPDGSIIGGGSVESYGYSSTLDQNSSDTSPVNITINQPYSLIDAVSTSSAFFAEAIASLIESSLNDPNKKRQLVSDIEAHLTSENATMLLAQSEQDMLGTQDIIEVIERYLEQIVANYLSLDNIIPTYNYWPIGKESENRETEYTDGGTLDNTGVLGMLSQTDTRGSDQEPIYLIAFDNTDTPLEKINGNIIAASQIAPLFGIDFDVITGDYQPFTAAQKDPTNPDFAATSLTSVFDNNAGSSGKTPFDELVAGLYAASCGAAPGDTPDDAHVNTEPAFYLLQLTTIGNSLANVSAGRTVHLFYIQNAKILNWQNQIGDAELLHEIVEGQSDSFDPFGTFKNFPYYNTFYKIGLEPKESNALSQMWAWAIADDASPLKTALQTFIDNASS